MMQEGKLHHGVFLLDGLLDRLEENQVIGVNIFGQKPVALLDLFFRGIEGRQAVHTSLGLFVGLAGIDVLSQLQLDGNAEANVKRCA